MKLIMSMGSGIACWEDLESQESEGIITNNNRPRFSPAQMNNLITTMKDALPRLGGPTFPNAAGCHGTLYVILSNLPYPLFHVKLTEKDSARWGTCQCNP
ncbi:hypothetical protein MLD38_017271 [Melastoma candidum]|uniref:Uncharacterized protein n=1 Tax=Melastoma candidum TaxID=119954 RepID=A0ACB9QYB4_9MYRT|nr:hypothetical protein MLD38_017271 [Melastoma candidum]